LVTRLGFPGFDFPDVAAVFDEHARLSGFENRGRQDFDISGLAGLDAAGYARLKLVQWPVPAGGGRIRRLFGDGRFFPDSGRANFVPIAPQPPPFKCAKENLRYPLTHAPDVSTGWCCHAGIADFTSSPVIDFCRRTNP
jgi:hypothetical protein